MPMKIPAARPCVALIALVTASSVSSADVAGPATLAPRCRGAAVDLRKLLTDPGACAVPWDARLGLSEAEQAAIGLHLEVKPVASGATTAFRIRIVNSSAAPIRVPFRRDCGSVPLPLRLAPPPGTLSPGTEGVVRLDAPVACKSTSAKIESVVVEVAPHGHVFLDGKLRALTQIPGQQPQPVPLARGRHVLVTDPGFSVPLDEKQFPFKPQDGSNEPLRMAFYPRLIEPLVVR